MKPNLLKNIFVFVAVVTVVIFAAIRFLDIKINLPKLPAQTAAKTSTTQKQYVVNQKDKTMTLGHEDIDTLLALCCSSTIANSHSSKQEDSIGITGKSKYPYPADFSARVKLKIENEKLKSTVEYLKVGKIESPSFVGEKISLPLQRTIDDKINKNYRFKDVKITSEGLTLELI